MATGRYLGEDFDLPKLDTLFLVFPISWKETIAQYAGRLRRIFVGKTHVEIYNVIDAIVPVLTRMADKRRKGYEALGYEMKSTPD